MYYKIIPVIFLQIINLIIIQINKYLCSNIFYIIFYSHKESLRKEDDNLQKQQPVLSKSIEIQNSTETDVLNNSPTMPRNVIEILVKQIIEDVEMKDKTTPVRGEFITTKDHSVKFF